jgi:hypothetical protein
MSILQEALNDLSAANYAPGQNAAVNTVDGWQVVKSGHGLERNVERSAEHQIDELITRIVKRLKSPLQRITRSGLYMFFSKGLNRGAICNIDFAAPQLRIVTILDPGHDWARPDTKKVFIEGVAPILIEID